MSRNTEATDDVKTWTGGPLNYKEGFFTQLATDELAKGINEEVVRAISAKRNEPEWMLEFRLNAYRAWLEMEEPHWLKAHYDKLNYQDYSYYSAPSCGNCDDTCASEPGAVQQTGANAFLSKEVEAAFEQLGVPVREGKEVAVDAIFDSVSVATTYRENWRSRELFSVPLVRRSTITRNWCVNISAPWCRGMTTSLPRLMRR
ncbi:cysteine desulfurase activator complex subunit SufB [Escherichia coli]|nr:cysteine desulfurase activator complex subunit SufB [Escherichia coli]